MPPKKRRTSLSDMAYGANGLLQRWPWHERLFLSAGIGGICVE
jgi:hypothetical protein